MDIKLLLACIFFLFIGIIIMIKNKFYKHPSDDMLFATEFKIFSSGLLFCFIGICGIIDQILKMLN
jgi:hypothetical protein